MNTSKLIPSAFAAIAVATSAALPLAATATTTIVHDAARDLCLNQANAATYTNVYGGVWTFMRADSNTGARTVLTSARQKTGTHNGQEVAVQRGPSHKDSNGPTNPWFSVNPTAWDDENEIFRGNGFPVIPPGGLSCHPGRTDGGNGSDTKCAVLRFTVPRSGTYRVVARAWDQNTGTRGVSLLVNGAVQGSRQTWSGNDSSPTTKDFSLEAAAYSAGDTIEFAIDGNNTYHANATGLEFKIEETVADAVDAGAAFRAGQSAASPANPFADAFGSWSALYTDGLVTNKTRNLMNVLKSQMTEQGTALSGWATSSATPYLFVNMADKMVITTNETGVLGTTHGRALIAREFMLHPKNGANAAVVLRVLPAAGGVFDIGVSARDMNRGQGRVDDNMDGVNVWLLNGGRALGKMRVSAEVNPASGTIFVPEVRVAPGIPVEVVVDNCGNNTNDLTGLVAAFVKRDIPGTSWSANSAMIASEKSGAPSNPFSQNGATWTAGYCNGGVNGPFTAYRTRYDVGTAITGWKLGTAANIPRIAANKSGRILTSMENGAQLPLGEGALMGHPSRDNGATAVRFTAPRDGVYSASAWATDFSYADNSPKEDNGVAVHILAGGKSLDSITIKSSASVTGQGVVGKDRIYLKSGETIDFVIDMNGYQNNDATELYAWVDEEASLTAQSVLSVDFDCGASGTYAGKARVGYSDALWNRMNLQNGAASAKSRPLSLSSSERTAATLTLSKAGGIAATANDGAMDTEASALFRDGVASTGTSDVTTFTLSGLLPGTDYELYLYSRAKSGDAVVNGAFASSGANAVSTDKWFVTEGGDYAVLTVRSDANGVATGTFSSATDATAVWGGVQIVGPGFEEFVPDATTVIFR